LLGLQREAREVHVARKILEYVVALCEAARSHKAFLAGHSSRASIGLMNAARARALVGGRDVTFPDDVKCVAPCVLRHRLPAKSGADRKYDRIENVITEILDQTPVPVGQW